MGDSLPVAVNFPSGTVFPSGLTSTKWFNNNGGATSWLAYQIGTDLSWVVTQYTVSSANDMPGRNLKNWQFQGSSDGVPGRPWTRNPARRSLRVTK